MRDEDLLRDLATLVARDRAITADILAHIAEVDARRLYLPAAYPSMHAYCVGALHLADDAAYKRVQAARAARRFPQLFEAVADGRLHLA
ncbi:MAG: HNH endonuclease, partial [Candidatus Rokuibacteriota bacterium]